MAWSKPEWNDPVGRVKPVSKEAGGKKSNPFTLIGGAVVLIGILVATSLLLFRSGSHGKIDDKKDDRRTSRMEDSRRVSSLERKESKERKGGNQRAKSAKQLDNALRNELPQTGISAADRAARIAEEERQKKEAWRIADSNRLAKSEAILAAQAPRKYFDNEVENTLEIVSKPGAQFLILPQVTLSQQEVLDYLKAPIEITEDDDDETIAAKKRTAAFKEQALDYIAKGGTINQFIRDQAAAAADEREALDEIRREKDRILITEGPEAAKAYLDKINPELQKMNMPEIRMGRADVSRLRHQQRKLQQQEQEK